MLGPLFLFEFSKYQHLKAVTASSVQFCPETGSSLPPQSQVFCFSGQCPSNEDLWFKRHYLEGINAEIRACLGRAPVSSASPFPASCPGVGAACFLQPSSLGVDSPRDRCHLSLILSLSICWLTGCPVNAASCPGTVHEGPDGHRGGLGPQCRKRVSECSPSFQHQVSAPPISCAGRGS